MNRFPSLPEFLARQWFLVGLIVCLSIGWAAPEPLIQIAELKGLRFSVVGLVMFSMALNMPRSQWIRSLKSPWPWMLASLINVGLMPLIVYPISWLLDETLAQGLLVAAVVPSTMASAAVWTRRGGGDESIPMMVTLLTNGTCFIVAPAWIQLLLGTEVDVPFSSLMTDLIGTVLLPITLAQLCLRVRPMMHWSERNRTALSHFCQVGILTMVMFGGVQIGKRWDDSGGIVRGALLVAEIVSISLVLHLVLVAIGWQLSSSLRWQRPTKIGVSISGGQKTLMVGLQLAMDCGASILPMVAYHVTQLLADSWLVQWWNSSTSTKSPSASSVSEERT